MKPAAARFGIQLEQYLIWLSPMAAAITTTTRKQHFALNGE